MVKGESIVQARSVDCHCRTVEMHKKYLRSLFLIKLSHRRRLSYEVSYVAEPASPSWNQEYSTKTTYMNRTYFEV